MTALTVTEDARLGDLLGGGSQMPITAFVMFGCAFITQVILCW